MNNFIIIFAFVLLGSHVGAQSVQANLKSAKKSIKAMEWNDAILSAKAALTQDNGHQEAYFILHSAYSGSGGDKLAVLAALDCYDAPPRGKKSAKAFIKKVRKYIKVNSPTLNAFLKLRSYTATKLMKSRKSAAKSKKPSDVEWIELIAARVAPTDEDVLKATNRRSERYWRLRGHGGSKPTMESGFISLTKAPDDWELFNTGEGSKVSEVCWLHFRGVFS